MTNLNQDARDMVNLAEYPIVDLESADGAAFARSCREEYLQTGLCMLEGFILPNALQTLVEEAAGFSSDAYFCKSSHNAYLTANDSVAADDVASRQEQTFVGSVPYDRIDPESQLNGLYQWDPLKNFIGQVLGKEALHRFADPFGACSINVFVDGGEHGWHFDESEFTVTLMLQPPEVGGVFEYVPLIRGRDDEKKIVASLLDGDRDGVVELPFSPGTLLIFGGNQTIHRVTRVQGDQPRLVPVLCFSETPGQVNSESVRQLFWGRSGIDTDSSTTISA
jgi:hypothetical protein